MFVNRRLSSVCLVGFRIRCFSCLLLILIAIGRMVKFWVFWWIIVFLVSGLVGLLWSFWFGKESWDELAVLRFVVIRMYILGLGDEDYLWGLFFVLVENYCWS